MDIFTDASLNDRKKIAGVSAIYVPSQDTSVIIRRNTYCSVSHIETAELFAIAIALASINCLKDEKIRVVVDSVNALRKIQRIFHHPDQKQIHTISDLMQKRILYNMATSFSKMPNIDLSFCYLHGHQTKAKWGTDGYYNMIADDEANIGRINGENMRLKEERYGVGNNSFSSMEEDKILAQQECFIVSPDKISFLYEDLTQNPKTCSRIQRQPKNRYIKKVCSSQHHTKH